MDDRRDSQPRESSLDTRASKLPKGEQEGEVLRGQGHWYDGVTSRRQPVRLRLSARSLRLTPEAAADAPDNAKPAKSTRHRLADLRCGERWDGAPLAVVLPDGGTVWVDDDHGARGVKGAKGANAASFAQALIDAAALARRNDGRALPWPSAASVIASWPAVVACLVATLALLAWFDRQGAAAVATASLQVVPTSVDRRIGDTAWKEVRQWLADTEVPEVRQLRLKQRFGAVASEVAPGTPVQLRFHRMRGGMPRFDARGGGGEGKKGDRHDIDDEDEGEDPQDPQDPKDPKDRKQDSKQDRKPQPAGKRGEGGFNAFAMPNGTIVLLDGLTEALSDDEIMAVLGHELGHVVHRHSMKGVMRSAGLLTVASVVIGDFSSVVASTVASLQTFRYSRVDEREADAFGRRFADTAKLPAGTEAKVWRKFQKEEKRSGAKGIPEWLSTHPPTQERLKDAR
jgi:Peptidase family M48